MFLSQDQQGKVDFVNLLNANVDGMCINLNKEVNDKIFLISLLVF